MEEKDIDQQIEELSKITREDGKEIYAQAQVKLGDIYRKIKHDYDQAEAFYLNINKKDNPEYYALAQFGLGYIYQEIKHDYDQAEAFYLNINKEDNPESYADAQIKLGYIYQEIKHDYDQAEAFYLNINKENNPESYADAQIKLGYIYQEIKHDYDQAEAFYLNINKEDNPESYAKAQVYLGYIYQEIKHDYDQAEAFYLNVNKEDDPESYTEAQVYLGYIYQEIKHDYDQAEAFYLNINKEDNPESYAKAQVYLGYIYQEIKLDYDQAEAFYLNITKEDNPESYAEAQTNLGYIYFYIKHNYNQAELFYLNINKEDDPELYALAQFGLGNIYYFIKHNYDKAETAYLNITKEDNPELYAAAQVILGLLYSNIKQDCAKAETYFSNITKEDFPDFYSLAQFSLGNIYYFIKHNYDKAEACYLNVSIQDRPSFYIQAKFELGKIYSSTNLKNYIKAHSCFLKAAQMATYSNCNPYYYICSQFILKLKQNDSCLISSEKEFLKLKEIVFDKIEKICKFTDDIKNILLIFNQLDNNTHSEKEPERRVAHYTKPAVLFNLLKGKNPSKFRFNIVDFMNDPSENQVLTSWLNISNYPDSEIKSFLASFSFNHNCLNQFRLYGNEDNIVGSGVSIAFNKDFFGLDTERSINNEIISSHSIKSINPFENKQIKFESNNNLHPLPLYRCLYFDPETGYMALAKRNKQSFYLENKNEKKPEIIDSEWDDYIGRLDESGKISKIRAKLKDIRNLIEELSNNPELQKISNLDELLSLAVLPISCLIKHAAFEDEDECRMIYITHISDDNIVEPQDYQSANSLYVEYTYVEEYIDNIYLGPQCKMQHKIWLQNHFKKKQRKREIKLIKSEMPLR